MAAMRTARQSSFSRNQKAAASILPPGVRLGSGSAAFVSSGIPDLDKILGGGFLLGSVVIVLEDADAPHHLLLLRNFMAQGVVHRQPLLFASPADEPRGFLGTLPAPVVDPKDERRRDAGRDRAEQGQGLRIAWQYKKYFGEEQGPEDRNRDVKQEFSSNFDLRNSLERQMLTTKSIDCVSIKDCLDLAPLHEHCSSFLSKISGFGLAGRIAIQSLCAPQCRYSDWDMVCFVRFLRAMLRSSSAVAVISFPSSVIQPSFSKRLQHLADTLLSVRAIPDDDKDMAKLLTGYQDMIGLLHVHKVARINTQAQIFLNTKSLINFIKNFGRMEVSTKPQSMEVPFILEASTFSLKLHRRRTLVLERLNQAPVDGSSGTSNGTSSSCSGIKGSSLDF